MPTCRPSSRRSRTRRSDASPSGRRPDTASSPRRCTTRCAWFSTGLGDAHTHDAQIGLFTCGYNADIWRGCLRIDPDEFFDDPAVRLAPDAESIIVLANPVQPHSEGEIVLDQRGPGRASRHPHELLRGPARHEGHDRRHPARARRGRALAGSIARSGRCWSRRSWPTKHGHVAGDTPSDALLEDLARHYSATVYHLTSTCRIGDVVDPRLRVHRRRQPARRRRQRHAQRRERQHERAVDHDRREGSRDDRGRSRRDTCRSSSAATA